MVTEFASTEDLGEKQVSFDQIGSALYAYSAGGDPNSGVIVGDDAVMVIDAQPTPAMANDVIARVAKITDRPVKYVLLTHYHGPGARCVSLQRRGDPRLRCDPRIAC